MTAIDSVVCVQLKALVQNGVSIEDAAESLDLDADAAKDYLTGTFSNKELSVDELIKHYKPRMIEVLASIALDDTCDNINARVSAAKVFVEGKGEIPELPVDKLSEAYKKMKSVITAQSKPANVTVTTPSSSTTVVEVKNLQHPSLVNVNN